MKYLSTILLIPLTVSMIAACSQPAKSNSKHSFLKHRSNASMGKAHQTMKASIEAKVSDKNVTVFTGEVIPNADVTNGYVLWTIPATAQLISGNLNTPISMKAGALQTFTITVKSLKDGDKVLFLPYQLLGSEKLGSPSLYVVGQEVTDQKADVLQKSTRFNKERKVFQ